ncbi:MlaD family protein [Antrihabitans stalactiti]|uniref:MCE family protein n=1 Tax=Antrihabitans stalactiti TaxID=2584121 RepID=A0A848KM12_9NOCA|nr:MlaD family protein [Antrihabitans stalactiti]NMN98896.1 MCE family protein [Antrihabitans stalactiti]
MNRILASRGFMSVTGVLVAAALVLFAYVITFDPAKKMQSYCALMPDAVGLYTGNHVTMFGLTVGTVTDIAPQGETVRVDFDVDADHPLRGAVSATTVSDTLVADRNLAVLSDTDATDWDPNTCITRTLTPKSMTRTLNALATLADTLNGSNDPVDAGRVNDGIHAIDTAISGTGPRINELITKLGVAFNSPDAAIGHIGELIDVLSELSASVSTGWGDIKDMLLPFADVLDYVNQKVWVPGAGILDSLRQLIPMINDITTMFGEPILQVLDATVPVIHFIGANVATLREIITMIPPILGAFTRSSDPQTGKPGVTYAPPKVAIPASNADQVCATVNTLAPGRCSSAADGLATIDLLPVVLGLAGTR